MRFIFDFDHTLVEENTDTVRVGGKGGRNDEAVQLA